MPKKFCIIDKDRKEGENDYPFLYNNFRNCCYGLQNFLKDNNNKIDLFDDEKTARNTLDHYKDIDKMHFIVIDAEPVLLWLAEEKLKRT